MPDLEPAFEAALALHRAGRYDEAIQGYRELVAIDPLFAKAWHLLGLSLYQRGDAVTGAEYIERAIILRNDNAVYYGNLGVVYRSLGRLTDSLHVLQRAIALKPDFLDARVNLGHTLSSLCHSEPAAVEFRTVLEQRPQSVEAHTGLGYALSELGDAEGAKQEYHIAARLQPSPAFRVLAATQLPPVYQSVDELQAWRARIETEVDQLIAEQVAIDLATDMAMPVFSLAHQGCNDVGLMRKLSRLARAPKINVVSQRPPGAEGKIHIGFISAHFREHTIGKLMRGFIAHLDRREFFVTVFSVGHHSDAIAKFIQDAADQYVPLTTDVNLSRQAIAPAGLDVLFYTDIGMDQTTYSLAFSRLAPVQCVSWGHPDTTGLDTIDYFVSSELFESPAADEHYHERLVRLPSLPLYYYPPLVPESLSSRAALGLDESAHIYCCPQSIYKFHPDFDPILADILRRDPLGQVVLIRWMYPAPDEALRARWRQTMPDVVDRVRYVRRMSQPDFMSLLAASDVLLDPVRFGGGNTTAEAIAVGTPIVTLPYEFMRSRITAAFYRKMGLDELIASSPEQYVEQTVRLGTEAEYRQEWRERILASRDLLYEDLRAVRALEDFFRQAVKSSSLNS